MAATTLVRSWVKAAFCCRAAGNITLPFCHPILQLELVSEAHCNNVLPSCSQDSWPAADRTSCGREVKVMGLKFIGVSLRRFEINGWYMPLGFSFLCRYLCPPRPLLSLYRNFLKASPWWFVGILLLYET